MGWQKIVFCLHGRETTSWPFCCHLSFPSGSHWWLMCSKAFGLPSLLFFVLKVEEEQLHQNIFFKRGTVTARHLWVYLDFSPRHFPPSYLLSLGFLWYARASSFCFSHVSFYLVCKLKFLVNMQIKWTGLQLQIITGIKALHMEQHKTWQHQAGGGFCS